MRSTLRPDAVLVQAVIAGALSFSHLHDLAAAAGQDGWKAWAYPISVDLLLVAAWRRLRTLRETGAPTRSAWTWFTVALAASLGANVATAGLLDLTNVPDWLRILVAGWPALAFLGGTLLAHTPAPAAEPSATVVDLVESPAVETAIERGGTAELQPDPEPAPALPAVEPEPVTDPVPAPPAVAVPPALVAHARKVADDHHARTGSPIDTDTLRARLGVPPVMADAISAQLA
ncbi:DUF2637 domain-containing protein [Streptomyces solicathayae]|uniref:DUF2637 domain-containing protein n=1 Tax=Streptomyces solicathayae TaxID=3081768 RepID=A0ABZ0LXS0_9ACTN|nr:DUF2637 domain-containing protein [Streptomyces sp. HUAS YS2]WOX24309.1 DUF2637 domain-containing protein [Streptomyces sp. HUAS YS2]